MTDFQAVDPALIRAAAQAGLEGVGEALTRALAEGFQLSVAEAAEPLSSLAELDLDGPALVLQSRVGDACAIAILPASAGLAPAWSASPDENQRAKLGALAQELFFLTMPEELVASDQRFDFVSSAESLQKIELADAAHVLRITAQAQPAAGETDAGETDASETEASEADVNESADNHQSRGGELLLVWASKEIVTWTEEVEQVANAGEPGQGNPNGDSSQAGDAASRQDAQARRLHFRDIPDGIRQLPGYARSILKISVPVRVTLAQRKMGVDALHELAPGSIIQFNKSCEDTLSLEVGKQKIAEGEAVRVGEKFGLWITSIKMPDERFSYANKSRDR